MAHLSRAASLRDLRARSLCRLPSRPGSALSWHNLSGPDGNRGGACVLHGCRDAEELLAQLVRRELPLDEITPVPDPLIRWQWLRLEGSGRRCGSSNVCFALGSADINCGGWQRLAREVGHLAQVERQAGRHG